MEPWQGTKPSDDQEEENFKIRNKRQINSGGLIDTRYRKN